MIPYEHAIVHWSDHLERWTHIVLHLPIADAVCSWNLTSILNNPYEDATFHTRWSESLEILTHRGTNSLKKTLTRVTPNQKLNLLSQRHPSEVFFSYPNQKRSYDEMILNLQSIHVSSLQWIFEFACMKLISRCILQINCEEYKHRDCCSERRWKVVVLGYFLFLASHITIHYVPGKSNFQQNLQLQVICHFHGMKQMIWMPPFFANASLS